MRPLQIGSMCCPYPRGNSVTPDAFGVADLPRRSSHGSEGKHHGIHAIPDGSDAGPADRPSRLTGSRTGNAIIFAVRWSRVINGDRTAQMTLEKIGATGLRLKTIDKDPKTGRPVVTSDVRLSR